MRPEAQRHTGGHLAWQSLPAALRWQRGDCDLGCDLPCDNGYDLPSGKTCGNALKNTLQLADCCDCGRCDWGRRKRRRNKA